MKEENTTQQTLFGESTTRVGKHTETATTVYIGRADGGDAHLNNTAVGEPGWLGNPYPKAEYGRQRCIELFREDFESRLEADAEFRAAVGDLQGEALGCHCQRLVDDGPACHGEVIAEWVERLVDE